MSFQIDKPSNVLSVNVVLDIQALFVFRYEYTYLLKE